MEKLNKLFPIALCFGTVLGVSWLRRNNYIDTRSDASTDTLTSSNLSLSLSQSRGSKKNKKKKKSKKKKVDKEDDESASSSLKNSKDVNPSPPKFKEKIKVASYNILAGSYATSNMFPYCAKTFLDIKYRSKRILEELKDMNADIICLQLSLIHI
eukprot:TRINITY_DN4893_c0_g1_i1.p2 TRINITY_DN4893_c0_g1~~TRINITY_DN4893_c0_g1_i1.p2  ORF type:complete len:155 (-),score=31.41 TRINITY_DN4893_c0_g1_i1:60-524(-)